MRALLADDHRVRTLLLATRLRARGRAVHVARDAMQALMFALRISPDVVVLDVHVPGGTGVEALRKLMASARTAQIPVLVLSGSTDPEEAQRMLELGAREYLAKPAEPDVLDAALRRRVGAPTLGGTGRGSRDVRSLLRRRSAPGRWREHA